MKKAFIGLGQLLGIQLIYGLVCYGLFFFGSAFMEIIPLYELLYYIFILAINIAIYYIYYKFAKMRLSNCYKENSKKLSFLIIGVFAIVAIVCIIADLTMVDYYAGFNDAFLRVFTQAYFINDILSMIFDIKYPFYIAIDLVIKCMCAYIGMTKRTKS